MASLSSTSDCDEDEPPFLVPRKGRTDRRMSFSKLDRLLSAAAPPRKVVKELVVNYLLSEGLVQSAKKFMSEALISVPDRDLAFAEARRKAFLAMLKGDVETAEHLTEEAAPGLLCETPELHFAMLKHSLVMLISSGEVVQAIAFAQSRMMPLVNDKDDLKRELEEAMSLLIFDKAEESPLAYLTKPSLILETSRRLNQAIVQHQGKIAPSRLAHLFEEANWVQQGAAKPSRAKHLPQVLRT